MLTNEEFDVMNRVEIEEGSDVAEFALFNLELPSGADLIEFSPLDRVAASYMGDDGPERAGWQDFAWYDRQAKLRQYVERGYAFEAPPLDDYAGKLAKALAS